MPTQRRTVVSIMMVSTSHSIPVFVGVTVKDIDFKENTVKIDHQLQRTSNMEYISEVPKTDAGIRTIPMTSEVNECFKRIIKNRLKQKVEPIAAIVHQVA